MLADILNMIVPLACIAAILYLWYDASQEAKGAGRYAENHKR